MMWLQKSDALLLVGKHETSAGTIAEIDVAGKLGIPIFKSVSELNEYMMGAGT